MLKSGAPIGREREERRKNERRRGVSMGFWCGKSNAAITYTSSSLVFAFMTWPWIGAK